jgi:hypothetical protein
MKLARWIFWIAGVYGLAVLVPQYFLMERISRDQPPAITHPEYFYGFVGVAVAWQVAFLVIGYDPSRFRPLMLVAVLEKISFAIAVAFLFHYQQVAAITFCFGMIDLLFSGLFLAAWRATSRAAAGS